MDMFDELSILKHSVIAQLLLDASPGALFLSTEGQHNVGRTNRTLENNFQVEDRKVHLKKISFTVEFLEVYPPNSICTPP